MKKLKEMTMAFSGPPAVIGNVIRSPAELPMGLKGMSKKKINRKLKAFMREVKY